MIMGPTHNHNKLKWVSLSAKNMAKTWINLRIASAYVCICICEAPLNQRKLDSIKRMWSDKTCCRYRLLSYAIIQTHCWETWLVLFFHTYRHFRLHSFPSITNSWLLYAADKRFNSLLDRTMTRTSLSFSPEWHIRLCEWASECMW